MALEIEKAQGVYLYDTDGKKYIDLMLEFIRCVWLFITEFFLVGLLYVIGTLLTANKNFKTMIYTLVFAVLLNIVLNFYLIKTLVQKVLDKPH